jgi:hypothetical protein
MQLGRHMRELWDQKLGLAIALILATLAAARFLFGVGLLPPRIDGNSLGLASASTHVLVDTPRSSAVDLRQDTYNFKELTNRALLLGNVMASLPVRQYIAQHAGVPANEIRVTPPITLEQPRALADNAHQPKSSDILKSPHEYRLSIQANPTVPVLDIYTEAPSDPTAIKLANGAVEGLRDYLDVLAKEHSTPKDAQVELTQLGGATGGAIGQGATLQAALLAFVLVFAASSAAVLFFARVRRGWAASGSLPSQTVRGPT